MDLIWIPVGTPKRKISGGNLNRMSRYSIFIKQSCSLKWCGQRDSLENR